LANIVPSEVVGRKIFLIRGQKVLLDFDLAELYGVKPKRLKEQVRRNLERFPEDFMFQLNKEEFKLLRSQIAASSSGSGGRRYHPLHNTLRTVQTHLSDFNVESLKGSEDALASFERLTLVSELTRKRLESTDPNLVATQTLNNLNSSFQAISNEALLFFVSFLVGLLINVSAATAQGNIVISDSLARHADKLDVKKGARWAGTIAEWSFGDYAVVSSKTGWTSTETRRNLFNTETESRSTDKFSFVLTNGTGDSSSVDAAHNIMVQELKKLDLGHGFFIGGDELVRESDNFAALITVNRDTTETWILLMNVSRPNTPGANEAVLTNGERRIVLSGASSNTRKEYKTPWPALGYEFIENGRSLGALQFSGGLFGITYLVWIDRSLDRKMKLILAAAMTAALQLNSP